MIKIAALKEKIVVNTYIYEDMKEATRFYKEGAFGDADNFVEIPKDLKIEIGDKYENGEWIKTEPEISEPEPDVQAALVSLQQMSLMKTLGVEIPLEQQAEMEVKALANIDIPVADGEFRTGVKADKDAEVTYKGVTYKCIQPHITQSDWTPDKTPALWVVVQSEPEDGEILPWVAGESVKVGDKRTDKGKTYECIQAHTTQAGWEPANVPALWKLIE